MHSMRVIGTFFKLSALNEFQYRANFLMQLFSSLLALANGLAGLALVFFHTDSLAGWGPMELLAVVGVYTLVGGMIRSLIQPSMGRLLEGVHEGTLDHTLTKPGDSQLLVSFTEFQLWKLVDIVIGAAVLTFAVVRLGGRVGLAEAALFGALLLCGGLIVYSVWLAVATSAFWLVRIWSMFDLFEGLYQAGRWPVGIYPAWLRLILTLLVPVAFAVTVPAEALTARLTAATVGVVLLVTVAFLIGSRGFWKIGLRHYSGASA